MKISKKPGTNAFNTYGNCYSILLFTIPSSKILKPYKILPKTVHTNITGLMPSTALFL